MPPAGAAREKVPRNNLTEKQRHRLIEHLLEGSTKGVLGQCAETFSRYQVSGATRCRSLIAGARESFRSFVDGALTQDPLGRGGARSNDVFVFRSDCLYAVPTLKSTVLTCGLYLESRRCGLYFVSDWYTVLGEMMQIVKRGTKCFGVLAWRLMYSSKCRV